MKPQETVASEPEQLVQSPNTTPATRKSPKRNALQNTAGSPALPWEVRRLRRRLVKAVSGHDHEREKRIAAEDMLACARKEHETNARLAMRPDVPSPSLPPTHQNVPLAGVGLLIQWDYSLHIRQYMYLQCCDDVCSEWEIWSMF